MLKSALERQSIGVYIYYTTASKGIAMAPNSQVTSHKKRTNLSIDSQLLFEAKLLGINVSQGVFGVRSCFLPQIPNCDTELSTPQSSVNFKLQQTNDRQLLPVLIEYFVLQLGLQYLRVNPESS